MRRYLLGLLLFVATIVALRSVWRPQASAAAACVGDCNGDGEVTIDELISGVNIALGTTDLSVCPAFDSNGDGEVTIDEVLTAVNSALNGCGGGSGAVGDACTSDASCAGRTCFDSLPGGYCTQINCATNGCPAESTCFDTSDGGSACYKTCTSPAQCRTAEGYICDADNTCYLPSMPTPTPAPSSGRVGDPCLHDSDCADNTCFTDLPGGYCSRLQCAASGCPDGSSCFDLTAGGSACYQTCTLPSQCRSSEGYTCDADNTCYPVSGPTPTPRPDLQPVGAACTLDTDCMDAWCFTDLPGGYCTRLDCARLGCPSASVCFDLADGDSACYRSCTSVAQCRGSEGYICDNENTCYVP
ncbi:MAG TPA: hypothetical protein VMT89_01740 [Candidatus Acidoferrales bacterium]|nr:hypothetical protein [Candidatus Acidoferrales bacterium]